MVHVWGLPEERALEADEALCDAPGEETLVLFHIEPRRIDATEWCCARCGFATTDEGGSA